MRTEILAPKTGLTAESIRIVKWHKKKGESVRKDETLLTIESEKTTIEIGAPASGCLVEIMHEEGDEVPISSLIGIIDDEGLS
jgi:dihydrolipoamide dehydrogenase